MSAPSRSRAGWTAELVVALAVVALAGCASRGPAWPKSAGTVAVNEWSEDGGESIAPHTARAAAVEKSAEPTPEAKPDEAAAPKAEEPAAAGAGSGSAESETPIELPDEILGEEIIIEIED